MSDEKQVPIIRPAAVEATTDIAPTIPDVTPPSPGKHTNEHAQQQASTDTPAPAQPPTRKRPRLDLSVLGGAGGDGADGRERKRGKTMFGILVGTLNKAKIEDKERNASDAAKKRQQIEQRLQDKLKRETDSVRRAEEAKKDKTHANRKEEDLQLKDSIYKLRRTRLPLLSNFLLTSDVIPSDFDDTSPSPFTDPLAPVPRSHPPPLYYLPAVLLPQQEAYLKRRKAEVREAADKEWLSFKEERAAGILEINNLRQRVADEEAKRKGEPTYSNRKDDVEMETSNGAEDRKTEKPTSSASTKAQDRPASSGAKSTTEKGSAGNEDVDMEVDEGGSSTKNKSKPKPDSAEGKDKTKKNDDESVPMQADDDDAVEY
ncbi:hypothetical protein AX16_004271 [Volvariella volvacea WC 439]|nr:hypothetical protein AX16_004271 [Volvariella volvacea WC 439]